LIFIVKAADLFLDLDSELSRYGDMNLVGSTIRNLGKWGVLNCFLARSLMMIGRAKANVLPEPVRSLATISSPLYIR
jgi:hypothetical protein